MFLQLYRPLKAVRTFKGLPWYEQFFSVLFITIDKKTLSAKMKICAKNSACFFLTKLKQKLIKTSEEKQLHIWIDLKTSKTFSKFCSLANVLL